jgi:hypothetical protein
MIDILFQPSVEAEEFSLKDLFANNYFSEGLNRLDRSTLFETTPQQLFKKIQEIALIRFEHQLPEQKKL